jgi:DNA polymerase zeta
VRFCDFLQSNFNSFHHRFAELPRRQQFIPLIASSSTFGSKKGTISQFFSTTTCPTCDNQSHQSVCSECRRDSQKTVLALSEEIFNLERKAAEINSICESCCMRSFDIDCQSLDCPVLYASVRAKRNVKQVQYYREILDEF